MLTHRQTSKRTQDHGVEIRHAYRTYDPPPWIDGTIHRLLAGIPPKYISGLSFITLTNAGGFNRERRRKRIKRKNTRVKERECAALYHQRRHGQPASIELIVDNVEQRLPRSRFLLALRPLRDLLVATILYHEVGHHIHRSKSPEHREPEDVADKWSARLSGYYMRHTYWYIWPPIRLLLLTVRPFAKRWLRKADSKKKRGGA